MDEKRTRAIAVVLNDDGMDEISTRGEAGLLTEEEEIEGLDLAEHGQHAYDLGTGTGASIYDEVTSSISLRSAEATEGTSRLASSNT